MSEKRESAEERALFILGYPAIECLSQKSRDHFLIQVIDQIKEAETQARAEGIHYAELAQYQDRNDEAVAAYEKGWRECREAAAKVVEAPIKGNSRTCYACDCCAEVPQEYYPPLIASLQPPSEAGR